MLDETQARGRSAAGPTDRRAGRAVPEARP
jgi:hypothetical protein